MKVDPVRRLRGLLFDLDDTLLCNGALSEAAYSALFRLRDSGLELYVVTGRPAAWGEMLVRQWPIVAAITENGAIRIWRENNRIVVHDPLSLAERAERTWRLRALSNELKRAIPELRFATDVRFRISDLTFDIGETEQIAPALLARAVSVAHAHGARTSVSSVHLHISFEVEDKASGAVRLLLELMGVDPTQALQRYAFVGDSENDQACFSAFELTIGVANLSGRPTVLPRFITAAPRGAGFVELARKLVSLRQT